MIHGSFQHLGIAPTRTAPSELGPLPLSNLQPCQPIREDSHAANIVQPNLRTTAEVFPLLYLPPELVLCVFDVLKKESDWATLTCLGLSCKMLYHTLKERYHPTPISLSHNLYYSGTISENLQAASLYPDLRNHGHYIPLTHMIKDFIGPDYRLLGGEFPPIFVSRKVYGEADDWNNEFERNLRGRRRDFRTMTFYRNGETKSLLPSPYNKGEGWAEEVWEVWLQFDKLGWTEEMEAHFRRKITSCNVFKKLVQRMQLLRIGHAAINAARKRTYSMSNTL